MEFNTNKRGRSSVERRRSLDSISSISSSSLDRSPLGRGFEQRKKHSINKADEDVIYIRSESRSLSPRSQMLVDELFLSKALLSLNYSKIFLFGHLQSSPSFKIKIIRFYSSKSYTITSKVHTQLFSSLFVLKLIFFLTTKNCLCLHQNIERNHQADKQFQRHVNLPCKQMQSVQRSINGKSTGK